MWQILVPQRLDALVEPLPFRAFAGRKAEALDHRVTLLVGIAVKIVDGVGDGLTK